MTESDFSEPGQKKPDEESVQGTPQPPPLPPNVPLGFKTSSVPPKLPASDSSDIFPETLFPEAPPKPDSPEEFAKFLLRHQSFAVPELNEFFHENNLRHPPPADHVFVVPPIHDREDFENRRKLRHWWDYLCSRVSIGSTASLVFHVLLTLLLMLIVTQVDHENHGFVIIGGTIGGSEIGGLEILEWTESNVTAEVGVSQMISGEMVNLDSMQIRPPNHRTDVPGGQISGENLNQGWAQAGAGNLSTTSGNVTTGLGNLSTGPGGFQAGLGHSSGGGFASRTAANQERVRGQGGVSTAGQNAMDAGLQWLVAHQFPDGGWDFRLNYTDPNNPRNKTPCPGLCSAVGPHPSRNAATGLALLAFFGAGHTHMSEGPYQSTIFRGLTFLKYHAKFDDEGRRDYRAGTENEKGMYTQGIAVMALCEVYGMTKDPSIRDDAQRGLDFITWAQNRQNGGWRYRPYVDSTETDTTVTVWQHMALKSGQMAGLDVSERSLMSINYFLDRVVVSGSGGSMYAYMAGDAVSGPESFHVNSRRSTTAMGLLMRLYLGWKPGMDPMDRGITHLDEWGPSFLWTQNSEYRGAKSCLYYDYYATLALHHYGSSAWSRFYPQIYDYLILHQAKTGHESGSWFFPDYHGDQGGRLLNTCLAIMILEVPYRYLPLYRNME